MRRNILSFTLSTLLLNLLAINANATTYNFIKIADTSSDFISFGTPAINNKGTVAFEARLAVGNEGIFTGNGGSITNIVTSGNFPNATRDLSFSPPAINDNDTVAFTVTQGSSEAQIFIGLYIQSQGVLNTIVDAHSNYVSFGATDINNKETVVFSGSKGGVNQGIFAVNNGGDLRRIPDTSPTQAIINSPALNNNGVVAFEASLKDTSDGIFVNSGGSTSSISNTSGDFRNFSSPAINDLGVIAFRAGLQDQSTQQILTSSNGQITTIATASTKGDKPFTIFDGSPSINNKGLVVFEADLGQNKSGIFSGPDVDADKIIADGNSLFGSIVKSISFSRHGLNDAGQITFTATLANGSQVVVRAEPSS